MLSMGVIAVAMFATLASTSGITASGSVALDEVASGLSAPVYVDAPTGDGRLFAVEQGGRIKILEEGLIRPTAFLDISAQVSSSGEQGLLGLAFHPSYGANGLFYVHYTDRNGDTVVAEYGVSADPNIADPSTRRVVLSVDQPATNHNGGSLAFGPDGFLYLGLGDGGGSTDKYGNGQNLGTLLGSIVRINPMSGAASNWAAGARNPWRFSFDAATALLYVGDVGQGAREEITVLSVPQSGANLGWPILEGSICRPPTTGCTPPPGYVPPIHEYPDPGTAAVVGGYVYRGSELPDLVGTYFYADVYEGAIRSFVNVAGVATQHRNWAPDFGSIPLLVSFGTDGFGELYAVSLTGSIYRFASAVTRISGSDRYATATAVSRHAFSDPTVAYVVTGENWPDALVASSVGDGPVLLTRRDSLPAATAAELARIAPVEEIVVVGGPAAVSDAVVAGLAAYATDVTRLHGVDRYATAAAFSSAFHPAADRVYVATGETFPDALVTAAAAGHTGAPLLLVRREAVPAATVAALAVLHPSEIVIAGGTAAVSVEVEARLGALASVVRRVHGPDRFATAAAISADTFREARTVYVATGLDAPDALVAAAAATSADAPVLLVAGNSIPLPTASELTRLGPGEILLVGGPDVVSNQVQADLVDFERGP